MKLKDDFRPIPEWEMYEINSQGIVRRYFKSSGWRILCGYDNFGITSYLFSKNGKQKHYSVRVLLKMTFGPDSVNIPQINFANHQYQLIEMRLL